MDDAQQYTPAQAADPSTPGEVLAAIAGSRPDLRPHIAANPATYPALLDWLAQLGDPAVDAALRARGLEDTMAGGQPAPTVDERTTGPGATDTAAPSEPSTTAGDTAVAPSTTVGDTAVAPSTTAGDTAVAPSTTAGAEREVATGGPGAAPSTTPGEAATTRDQPSTAYEPPAAYVPPAAATSGYSGGGTPGYPGTGTDQPAGQGIPGVGDAGTPGPTPYGPPPGGPYGPPAGQPPKKSRTWLWILLGVLGVLLIGGILLAIFVVGQVNRAVDDAGNIFDTGEAQNYGDDPQLDALWDRCEGGDMAACDELFRESPVDSEYEQFGDTCGGRTEGGTWCEDLAQEGAAAGPGDGTADVVPALVGAGGVARTSSSGT